MLRVNQLVGFWSKTRTPDDPGGADPGAGPIASAYDPDAQAYFDRLTNPDTDYKDDLNDLILTLKEIRVWKEIDVLILAGKADGAANGSANSLLNIKGNVHNATLVGTPTFTEDTGWAIADAANYIRSNFAPNNSFYGFGNGNHYAGAYVRNFPDTNADAILGTRTYYKILIELRRYSASAIRGASQNRKKILTSTALGWWEIYREGADSFTVATPDAEGSKTIRAGRNSYDPQTEIYVGAMNDRGTATRIANGVTIGGYLFGSNMTASRRTLLRAAIDAYFTARGTAV